MPQPRIIIIARPNGGGKTTFAEAFLPEEAQCINFINADLIAKGLSRSTELTQACSNMTELVCCLFPASPVFEQLFKSCY